MQVVVAYAGGHCISRWSLHIQVYPAGLRFSGQNMDPLPCWGSGAQHVALNLGNAEPDLPVQLHFALFEDTGGYVLKPREMRGEGDSRGWPPPREALQCVTVASHPTSLLLMPLVTF